MYVAVSVCARELVYCFTFTVRNDICNYANIKLTDNGTSVLDKLRTIPFASKPAFVSGIATNFKLLFFNDSDCQSSARSVD